MWLPSVQRPVWRAGVLGWIVTLSCAVVQADPVPTDRVSTAAAALTTSASPAATAPATASANDPILALLSERGLLRPFSGSTAMIQSVRDSVRDTASDLVLTAMNFLGVPYRLGGNSASAGFDCSGFTRFIFENSLGLVLPRRSDEQAASPRLRSIGRHELQPGDLVFFNTMRAKFSHVGIYVGDDKFIHAPRSGSEVRIEDMRVSYWAARFNGARRADLIGQTGQSNATPVLR